METVPIYDAVAFDRNPELEDEEASKEVTDAIAHLKLFTQIEKAKAMSRFANMTIGVFIVMGSPKGGWDSSLYRKQDRILVDKCTIVRAYKKCAEMVPKDFTWEIIDEKMGLWGGILLNPKHRE